MGGTMARTDRSDDGSPHVAAAATRDDASQDKIQPPPRPPPSLPIHELWAHVIISCCPVKSHAALRRASRYFYFAVQEHYTAQFLHSSTLLSTLHHHSSSSSRRMVNSDSSPHDDHDNDDDVVIVEFPFHLPKKFPSWSSFYCFMGGDGVLISVIQKQLKMQLADGYSMSLVLLLLPGRSTKWCWLPSDLQPWQRVALAHRVGPREVRCLSPNHRHHLTIKSQQRFFSLLCGGGEYMPAVASIMMIDNDEGGAAMRMREEAARAMPTTGDDGSKRRFNRHYVVFLSATELDRFIINVVDSGRGQSLCDDVELLFGFLPKAEAILRLGSSSSQCRLRLAFSYDVCAPQEDLIPRTIPRKFLFACKNVVSADFRGLTCITSIEDLFMHACLSVREVQLDGLCNVESVGRNFMWDCVSLEDLDLRSLGCDKLTRIEDRFLMNCTSLRQADIRGFNNVREIGVGFMFGCASLRGIDLSGLKSVVYIGTSFLSGCSSLTQINVYALRRVEEVSPKFMERCCSLSSELHDEIRQFVVNHSLPR